MLLGSIHSLAMHTTAFCHCTCVQHKAGDTLQNPALWLIFSHAFGNWLRFFQGGMFSFKKKSTLQTSNISYDSSIWQTGFQRNPRRVSWQPTGHLTLPSAGGSQLPRSSVLGCSFCETLLKLGTGTHKWTALLCRLCPVSWPWQVKTCMSMRALVLSCSMDRSWMDLPSRHWSLSAALAVWKVWVRLRL